MPPIQDANAGYVREVVTGTTKVSLDNVEQSDYFSL